MLAESMSRAPTTLAVVTAAGGSTRMGQCKAMLDWCGAPLISAHVTALSRRCEVIVVTGFDADRVSSACSCSTVHNSAWSTTAMIDSVRLGIGRWAGPVLVQPVDTVPVEAAVLDALLAIQRSAVPIDQAGHPGHPVLIAPQDVERLADQPHLRALLVDATEVWTHSRLCALSFNDMEAYERVLRVARGGLEPPTPRV